MWIFYFMQQIIVILIVVASVYYLVHGFVRSIRSKKQHHCSGCGKG